MKTIQKVSAALALTIASFTGSLNAQDLDGTPTLFQDIGFSARAEAMGGAFVGLADDAYALTYNPAGLADLQRDECALMYTKETVFPYMMPVYVMQAPWREGEGLGGGMPFSGDTEGLSSEVMLLGAYGVSLLPFIPDIIPIKNLMGGSVLKVKMFSAGPAGTSRLGGSSASGFGMGLDLGVRCDITSQASVGVAFDNVLDFTRFNNTLDGSKGSYVEFNPPVVTVGAAIRAASFLLLTTDWEQSYYAGVHDRAKLGFEFNIANMIYPRFGYAQDMSAVPQATYTSGIGINYRFEKTRGIVFDYAFILSQNYSMNAHRINISYYWNAQARDQDGDNIADADDKCPLDPEDFDGFMDKDGCPELDNDNDSIPDAADRCPDAAEDKDGYEDADGCPEDDNDLDGILDADDKCPNESEDKDGYNDADGCPDDDNDADGIKDFKDQCPNEPEDKDGFQDADGCPDIDFDGDGVADDKDKCPNTPHGEKIDADGCPLKKFLDDDEDGVPNDRDKCPAAKEDFDGFDDGDGCPDKDNDQDGLLDSLDKCPNHKEDMDGFEDTDGCPDKDNDQDGILDSLDKCPAEKEVMNGFKDDDGCPDEKPKEIKKGAKMILRGVQFKSGSASLTDESYVVLGQVFESLDAYPEIIVEIRGYSDNVGRFQYNLDLSQKRAESVRQYMLNRGIAPKRIKAKGFGPADPIASNKTKSGREQNRRIEFARIK